MARLYFTAQRKSKEVGQSVRLRTLIATAATLVALVAAPGGVLADDFEELLARVDYGLQNNPSRVSQLALDSCLDRRVFAVQLYNTGQHARAERSLKYCFKVLEISQRAPAPTKPVEDTAAKMERIQAEAAREVTKALKLTPNLENGLEIYRDCALCHQPEGWGHRNGTVPQLAGQHRGVIVKQLADIRAGNRDGILMIPYATVEAIGGAQGVADVAGYIDTLEISVGNGKGTGKDLELGARLYRENCTDCHGTAGEGDSEKFVPRIQAQHYNYLVRQFDWIREGKRRNANTEMVTQIQNFSERETEAVLDYVSRLEPPSELQAPSGWQNPDFPDWRWR